MKKAYNLTGKASSVATTSILLKAKLCDWPKGMKRPMAHSMAITKNIAAIQANDANVIIFLFIILSI